MTVFLFFRCDFKGGLGYAKTEVEGPTLTSFFDKLPVPLLAGLLKHARTYTTTQQHTKTTQTDRKTERQMLKLSSSSLLPWPAVMALCCSAAALLLLVFGPAAVVWRLGGGGLVGRLEGGWSGQEKRWPPPGFRKRIG